MLRLFHRVVYFTAQRVTQRIQLLRPVQGDRRDLFADLIDDVLFSHRIVLPILFSYEAPRAVGPHIVTSHPAAEDGK